RPCVLRDDEPRAPDDLAGSAALSRVRPGPPGPHDAGRVDPVKRAALYARVSTLEQGGGLAVQLEALRRYADARGWAAVESVDEGVSGGQAQRAALDALLLAVRARRV